jgi:hypothetical protein
VSFSPYSAFGDPYHPLPQADEEMRKQIFHPKQAQRPEEITLPTSTVRTWWRDIDDALWQIEDGDAAGLERAVGTLERLRNAIEEEMLKHGTPALR